MLVKNERDIILKIKNLLQCPKTVMELMKGLEENLKKSLDEREQLKHEVRIEYFDDGLDAIGKIVCELDNLLRRY